ncbi:hypothetical protein T4B_3882 [Trichinella pseudospiralis]|uniref:Uncharacterized protein n=1 Tax=Trichinella pseudospiralis TaxID=6337 RepID=A0A0V1E000_TRIPS|nr:hypothetical protein T4A_182 [Trichinella pseudospiralis]KRZ21463.1 hypothetical protein T4B_3882 [Trichinella pseudospiralis]KRZ28288.1 hypothetical protein T4C_10131 [Trichinella pseudospiralis]
MRRLFFQQLLEYLKTLILGLNLLQSSVHLTIVASSIFQQSLLLSFKRSFISFTQPVVDKSIRIHIALIKRRRHFANTR